MLLTLGQIRWVVFSCRCVIEHFAQAFCDETKQYNADANRRYRDEQYPSARSIHPFKSKNSATQCHRQSNEAYKQKECCKNEFADLKH